MTMENFMKYRATVAQEQRDHFKAIQAKNGFIPSHEIIEIFQQSSESRELLDTRKKFCERREGLVAAKMIPVELDEYYETKQQELTMKRQGFFQKRQSWCIKHGLPTSGKSYHYAYLHFLGIKDIDEVIHE